MTYPVLPAVAKNAEAFVPRGWRSEFTKHGDLNADGRDDLLLVLRMTAPGNIVDNAGLGTPRFDTNPRMLAVALAQAGGDYRLALQDHALIPRPESPVMDDYLQDEHALRIARGAFSVTLHAWASAGSWSTGSRKFTFRLQDGCFRLIGFDSDTAHRGNGETRTVSVNYLTRKATIATGNFENNDAPQTQARRLPKQPLRCLGDVGDGFVFDPALPEG